MALHPAITDMEQLKSAPGARAAAGMEYPSVKAAKFDRDELSTTVGAVV